MLKFPRAQVIKDMQRFNMDIRKYPGHFAEYDHVAEAGGFTEAGKPFMMFGRMEAIG